MRFTVKELIRELENYDENNKVGIFKVEDVSRNKSRAFELDIEEILEDGDEALIMVRETQPSKKAESSKNEITIDVNFNRVRDEKDIRKIAEELNKLIREK